MIMKRSKKRKIYRLFERVRRGPLTVKRFLFMIGSIVFCYCYIIGDYGIYNYLMKKREVLRLEKEVESLRIERQKLNELKKLLKQEDLITIERIAREKYGMVKKGEKFIRIQTDDNTFELF